MIGKIKKNKEMTNYGLSAVNEWMVKLGCMNKADLAEARIRLNESQESKSIDAAKKMVMQKFGWDRERADQFIRVELRQDIPILRDRNAAKFILGVTRMYCDGQLRDARTIQQLNNTLKYVANEAHINEYDRNLNGMSAQDIIQRFAKNVEADVQSDREAVAGQNYEGTSDYNIVRIDSFEQAQQYSQYTSWCVTHQENMFNSYTNGGISQFYFCLRNGFENIQPQKGQNCPLDEYGLSMVAVCVDERGALASCTCRWNHDNGGNDNIMNTKQISQLIGQNFYDVFKPNHQWQDNLDRALARLKNGESPYEVFDQCDNFHEGYAAVRLNDKWNWIDTDGNILFPNQWFDWCDGFHEGYVVVELNGKFNFIGTEGRLLSPNQWFDYVDSFREGYATVRLNDKWNWIDTEGNLLFSNQWFDECWDFYKGYAMVRLNDKHYFIDTNCNLCDYETKQPIRNIKTNTQQNANESLDRIVRESINRVFGKNRNLISEAKLDALRKYHPNIDDETFQMIAKADPKWKETKADVAGGYTKWLLDLYEKDPSMIRRLRQISDDLREYNPNMQPDRALINQVADDKELHDRVKSLYGKKEVSKQEGFNKDIVYRNNDGWIVVVPSSFSSSRYWGQGTHWCTASEDERYYKSYSSYGPLYIIINTRTNEKWQFHKPSESYMDAEDDSVNPYSLDLPLDVVDFLEKANVLWKGAAFDWVGDLNDGYAVVELNNKCNFIDTDGNLLFPNQWFDNCDSFDDGYAVVKLNNKWNYTDTEGRLLSPNQWFDECDDFYDGYAVVELNNKCNWIDTDGNLVSPNQWFDKCDRFSKGYAAVKLNRKYNLIDTDGNLVSPNQWFDWCNGFHYGYALAELNGKYYFIDTNCNLCDYETKQPIRNLKTDIYRQNANESLDRIVRESINRVLHKL